MLKQYKAYWDAFYKRLDQHNGTPLWDVDSSIGAEDDFMLFKDAFDQSLPLLDFGCGTGRQTVYFKNKYPLIIGLDVSSNAIKKASRKYSEANVRFYDASDFGLNAVKHIVKQYSGINIYIRGVLHQIEAVDLAEMIIFFKELLGDKGKLFLHEVSTNIRSYFAEGNDQFSNLPAIMQRTFISNLPPKGMDREKLTSIFTSDYFDMELCRDSFLNTRLFFSNGDPIRIPSIQALFRSK